MTYKGSLLVIIVFLLALFYFLDSKPRVVDITKYGYEQTQDVIINNQVVKRCAGHRECQERYKCLRQVLGHYSRPFTMLDIAAGQGYYSFRTAWDYDKAVCVMLEGDNKRNPMAGTQLLQLCKANNKLNNIIFLNRPVSPEDVKTLSSFEYFDVVLAFNIIHKFGEKWKEMIEAVLQMGDTILIETPPEEEHVSIGRNRQRRAIHDYLQSKNAIILGGFSRVKSHAKTTLYLVKGVKKKLVRQGRNYFTTQEAAPDRTFNVTINFSTKTFTKRDSSTLGEVVEQPWPAGIHLLTFKRFQGAYPLNKSLKAAVKKIASPSYKNWSINNMILQGRQVVLLDKSLPETAKFSKESLKAVQALLDLEDPDEVDSHFRKMLIKN